MNDFLQSLRSDLLSRRLLPLVAIALLALAVAVGYALAGAGSTATPPPHASVTPSGGSEPAALAVAAASPNPNAAESETPGGLRYQSKGQTRNPFKPLTEAKAAASKSSTAGKSSASSGSSGSNGGSASGGTSPGTSKPGGGGSPEPTPPTSPKPSKPHKQAKFPYDVSVLFGPLSSTPGQAVTLPPYQNLQLQRPIPSASNPRIALERVNGDAKSAVFELLSPAILRGQGVCLPSPSECQQLALEVGHAEELEYVEEDGQTLVYELKTVSVVKRSSQAAG